MPGNSKHLSGAPGFDPYFQDLFYFISKRRFILFNRVGQRDLRGLFWRGQGPLAGIHEQGDEWDVFLLACTVLCLPPFFCLYHGVEGWAWKPGFLPWVAETHAPLRI